MASLAISGAAQEGEITATPRSFPRIQLNLRNPGARSLGMGGAFLALADDASAAVANPAGLPILRKPEVSIELRRSETRQAVPASGIFPDVATTNVSSSNAGPVDISFASAVMPLRHGAIALFYHQLLSYHKDLLLDQPVLFFSAPGGPVSPTECAALGSRCTPGALLPEHDSIDAQVDSYGIAGGWRFDRLSIGGSLRYHREQIGILSSLFALDGSAAGIVGETAHSSDVTWSVAAQWRPTDTVWLGAVYKTNPSLHTREFISRPPSPEQVTLAKVREKFPDVYGAGMAIRPQPNLTISFDAVRVTYSDFLQAARPFPELRGKLRAPDATELRAGAEYFILRRTPFAVRGGWWREPAHDVEFVAALDSPAAIANRTIFPGGRSEDHLTAGFGWSWPSFQVDAAWDHSRRSDTAALSFVARF